MGIGNKMTAGKTGGGGKKSGGFLKALRDVRYKDTDMTDDEKKAKQKKDAIAGLQDGFNKIAQSGGGQDPVSTTYAEIKKYGY